MASWIATGGNGVETWEQAEDRHTAAEDTGARVLLGLNAIMERRHGGLAAHGREVSRNCALVGRSMGIPNARVERLMLAGALHDLGKVAIPDDLLEKAGPLSAEEWRQLRAHPEVGARLLRSAGLADLAAWVLAHHERIDGRGYPLGLAGSEIPLEARILAVADAFDAMTSDRPYCSALDPEAAADELRRGAGSQFDPDVVEPFILSLGIA